MLIGFTGTRNGMSSLQKSMVASILDANRTTVNTVHHGDCIGADAECHAIAKARLYKTHLHPPDNDRLRAHCDADYYEAPLPYLVRNRVIVRSTTFTVAAPQESLPQFKGGTWSTIRMSFGMGHTTFVLLWDGTFAVWRDKLIVGKPTDFSYAGMIRSVPG